VRIISVCMLIALTLAACDDESEQLPSLDSASATPTEAVISSLTITPTPGIVLSDGDPHPELANTLPNLLKRHETVIVGTVLSHDGQRYAPKPTISGLPTSPPTPVTTFTVRVDRVIISDALSEGEEIKFSQIGGRLPDGRLYIDPITGGLLEPGPTLYLMFLRSSETVEPIEYFGPALGRFVVTADGLVAPNGHEAWPAVREISGYTYQEVEPALTSDSRASALQDMAKVTLDDAEQVILAAVSQSTN